MRMRIGVDRQLTMATLLLACSFHQIWATPNTWEGKYAGIVYQVGRIQFSRPDETGHRAMRFKYEILENKKSIEIEDDITSVIGDIIVDQMEKQIEKGELVYANGTD